jgi:hypothetical protein
MSSISNAMRLSKFLFAMLLATFCGSALPAASEDSVPALARSLLELPPDSSVLNVPEVLSNIGSTWAILKPGIAIRGAGPGKIILMRDPNFKGVLVRMDAERGTLSNLTLDDNGTAGVLSLNRTGVTANTLEVKNFTHIELSPSISMACPQIWHSRSNFSNGRNMWPPWTKPAKKLNGLFGFLRSKTAAMTEVFEHA